MMDIKDIEVGKEYWIAPQYTIGRAKTCPIFGKVNPSRGKVLERRGAYLSVETQWGKKSLQSPHFFEYEGDAWGACEEFCVCLVLRDTAALDSVRRKRRNREWETYQEMKKLLKKHKAAA